MTEVRFQPEPTFEAPVQIHVPGKGELPMLWTYKYRDVKEVAEFKLKWFGPVAEASTGKKKPKGKEKEQGFDSLAYLMDLAVGWELKEEFTRKNLEHFLMKYPTCAQKIVAVYFAELAGARLKNS